MYRILVARIAYRGISKRQMSEDIKMNYNTLLSKLAGKSKFTLDEALLIQEYLEEKTPIEQLFESG